MRKRSLQREIYCAIGILLLATALFADEKPVSRSIPISQWLVAGPIPALLPIYPTEKNIKGETFDLADQLAFDHADVHSWRPVDGASLSWDGTSTYQWLAMDADTHGVVIHSGGEKNQPEMMYLAAYIDVRKFTKATLKISGFHLFRVLVDDKWVVQKKKADQPKDDDTPAETKKRKAELVLEPGSHRIIVKTLRDPECDSPWTINGEIVVSENCPEDAFVLRSDPIGVMTISHMLDGSKVSGVSISPDGVLAAVSMRQSQPPGNGSESWLELRKVKDGSLVQTYRGGMKLSRIQWAPSGQRISYTSSGKKGATLWIVNLENGQADPVLKNIKELSSHTWSPDGRFIVYGITEKPKKDETGLKRFDGMPDHWPWYQNRGQLFRLNIPEKTRMRLTSGELAASLDAISPDGKQLLFTRSRPDFSTRPYSKTEFLVLDFEAMTVDTLLISPWANSASWSPDGKTLLFTGGAYAFNSVGKNVPDGVIPNNYDTQTFLYDLQTKKVDPITKDFDPSISSAVWSQTEKAIYIRATDKSYNRIYRYDLKKKTFQTLNTGVEVAGRFDLAENAPLAVFTGSGVSDPPKAYVLDLKKNKARVLVDPSQTDYADVQFGDCERWTFSNSEGVEIEGRIYKPVGFDPAKKYPCIVYYYGGTSPVTRDFGGRYPKEIWAANGYVVYVLQPSGATGFGQAFSALHVNNWGMTVAGEIMDGVQQFLNAHDYVDPKRVGCIGASYGGFMTMLLVTRTDLFSAAVSHAGISSISSYWGEGYWGYLYSSEATAESFPWNRKDIYVDQSPLFSADKVNTPLLLLHGNADTNVPPGESRQLYTALKLLGRDVELVEVDGQNHHILEYKKRIRWTKTIIAYFDKYLKGNSDWWEELYPEK